MNHDQPIPDDATPPQPRKRGRPPGVKNGHGLDAPVMVQLDRATKRKLKALASEQHRTMAGQIRALLAEALERKGEP